MNAVMTLYRSSIGKKAIVAVTGAAMFGFVLVHMVGNLLIFAGPDSINAYAEALQSNAGILWGARLGLLAVLFAHVYTIIGLTKINREARPDAYGKGLKHKESTAASRYMRWGGVALLLFIIFHLLHLTGGVVHPDFIKGNVYHNMVSGFKLQPWVAIIYITAMVALSMHLYHGVWSMLQTLGLNHPKYNDLRKKAAMGFAGLIFIGNCSMPIAILAGIIG